MTKDEESVILGNWSFKTCLGGNVLIVIWYEKGNGLTLFYDFVKRDYVYLLHYPEMMK